jgi:hypothetical protein
MAHSIDRHQTLAPAPSGPPHRRRRFRLIVGALVATLVAFCALAALINGLTSSDNSGPGGLVASPNVTDRYVGLNEPARDGKFEFTVTSIECGISHVGTDIVGADAQGQYCKVATTVRNLGDEAVTFYTGNQFAYNADGQKYSADAAAEIYLGESDNGFLTSINPGNTADGTIVFDIPEDASITKLELHDSAFSGGVTVRVAA